MSEVTKKHKRPSQKSSIKRKRRMINWLKRGQQIPSYKHHHEAMAAWKSELGDPRPKDLTLSRACNGSCGAHYMAKRPGKKPPGEVSLLPTCYLWETVKEQNARDLVKE